MKKLNLNSPIRVKLTDYGKYVYFHRFDELNKRYDELNTLIEKHRRNSMDHITPLTLLTPSYPEEDDDGFTEFLLWKFIELYGPYMHMGAKNVIEPLDIYILENVEGE